jgi:hypothetical protein
VLARQRGGDAPFEYQTLEKIARHRVVGVWGFPVYRVVRSYLILRDRSRGLPSHCLWAQVSTGSAASASRQTLSVCSSSVDGTSIRSGCGFSSRSSGEWAVCSCLSAPRDRTR